MMFPHSGFNLPVMRRKTWRLYILHFFVTDSWGNLSTPSTAHLRTCTSSCLRIQLMMTAAVSTVMCSHPWCSPSLVVAPRASHAWGAALLGATLVGPPLISINNTRLQLLLSAPDREPGRREGTVPSCGVGGDLPALSKFSPVSRSSNQLHNLTGLMKENQECGALNWLHFRHV